MRINKEQDKKNKEESSSEDEIPPKLEEMISYHRGERSK